MENTYTFNSDTDFDLYNREYTKLIDETTTTEKSELRTIYMNFCESISKAPYEDEFAVFLKDILNVKGEIRGVSFK